VNSLKAVTALLAAFFLLLCCSAAFATPPDGGSLALDADRLETGAPSPRFRPGELLVKFKAGVSRARSEMIKALAGVEETLREFHLEGPQDLQLIRLKPGMSLDGALGILASLAEVEYAEPNYLARAAYTPTDPDYQPEQWGLNNTGKEIGGVFGTPDADIDAPEAWDIERGWTSPVTVAVVDSGIDFGHPDLDDKIVAGGYNWAGISQTRFYYDSGGSRYYTYCPFGNAPNTQKLAQSITGTGQDLTHVGIALAKTGNPSEDITVSLKSNLADITPLASFSISPSEVYPSPFIGDYYRQLLPADPPITLMAGTTYYLVFETANNNAADYYHLYESRGVNYPNVYREGQEYQWDDVSWEPWPDDDFYFRTNPNSNPRDDNGHGTHVAGIVGAEEGNGQGGVGVSHGAGLLPLKVLDSSGGGTYADIIEAIRYAADNGARVINMSLGGTASSSALQEAVDYARGKGCVLLAAAGNNGDATLLYPAGCDGVTGMGATDNQDQVWSYSNHNSSVDLSAPGVYVYSTMPTYDVALNSWEMSHDYDFASGTSMATPMASGLAALLLSMESRYTPAMVEQVMEDNADDKGDPGRDDYYGYGRINADQALDNMPAFPLIDSLSPASGPPGSEVTIDGEAFGPTRGASYVSFDGVQAAGYSSWSDTPG